MVEILITVAEKVAEYLVDPVKLQLSYLFNTHHHVEDVIQKIDDLGHEREKVAKLVEEDIRQGDQIFPHVQKWLQATEAIIQKREGFVQDEERARKGCFHLKSCYNLSKRAIKQGEDIEAKLKQAPDNAVSYRPPPPPVTSSASYAIDGAFPSRESIFNHIMDSLRNDKRSIVGVWGMGGVGKTTLARQIAKRAEEEKLFNKVVMASSISHNPIISEIQTRLARTLGLRFEEGQDRSVALMNSMKNQNKILVILDDIWDKLDLGEIGIPYGDDHKGCKLLLTSSEREVVATDMEAQQVFHLPHLEAEEAWSLFKRTAGDSVEYSPDLNGTADEIVKKCEGLPIAIITIANALKEKRVGEWKNALKEMKMAKPTNIRGMSNNVYSCLELSYNHLEGDEVKSLFLLCGLLGGRRISKDDLLLCATGLDMFEGMYSMEEATNKLITLVQELIASSLLLNTEKEDNDRQRSLFFDDLFVKMHDVVRDVARSIASKDVGRHYVVSEAVELRERERRGDYMNYSGISLECEDLDKLPPRLVCPKLELFLLNSSFDRSQWFPWESADLRIPEEFFQGITKLRVLHMSAVSLRPSSSLGFLSSIRTLCLNKCQLEDITIIGEMKGLQVLSLAQSNIVELPKEIVELKDLKVLNLQDCFRLRIIPRTVISSLSGLECLSLSGCYRIEWGWDGESNNNNKAFLSEIKDLSRLRTLEVRVSDPSLITEDIWQASVNLTRYSIMVGNETIHAPNQFTRTLSLGSFKSTVVLLKSFSNLFETCQLLTLVKLEGISNVVYDLAKENGFPQLECLTIDGGNTMRHVVSSSLKWAPPRDTFCRLDRLDLSHLFNLKSVFDFHESAPILIECFGKLRDLRLVSCGKLRCVMSLPMQHGRELTFFPRLQKLELAVLSNLISFYSPATPDQHNQESMSMFFNQQAAFPALEELHVNVVGPHLRALWHNQFPAYSFSKLKKLNIAYCEGLQKVFPVSLVRALVQLEGLTIRFCQSLEEIITNEGDEDISDEATLFPKLTHLDLYSMVLLKRFCSREIKLRWPPLKYLYLRGCGGDQMGVLFEEIGFEGKVDAPASLFFVEKETFPILETLSLEDLNGVVEIWRGQYSSVSFSKLRVLSIAYCHDISIVISSTVIQNLHNLEELVVKDCGSVKEVIQLLDDEPTRIDLSKLKRLHLSGLPNLKGFCSATCTFRFPSLEKLVLSKCRKMEFFCKGVLHISKSTLEEYILGVLCSNAQAFHETSRGCAPVKC